MSAIIHEVVWNNGIFSYSRWLFWMKKKEYKVTYCSVIKERLCIRCQVHYQDFSGGGYWSRRLKIIKRALLCHWWISLIKNKLPPKLTYNLSISHSKKTLISTSVQLVLPTNQIILSVMCYHSSIFKILDWHFTLIKLREFHDQRLS